MRTKPSAGLNADVYDSRYPLTRDGDLKRAERDAFCQLEKQQSKHAAERQAWLNALVHHIEVATGRKLTRCALDRLRKSIELAEREYVARPDEEYVRLISTAYRLIEPIGRAMQLLKDEINRPFVVAALGSDGNLRLANLLCDLEQVAHFLPRRSQRGRGSPKTAEDLYKLTRQFAGIWTAETGLPFTQEWSKDEPPRKHDGRRSPLTRSAMFVTHAVNYFSPECYNQLPTIMARIVKERTAGK
jgi:hypothetical protein